MKYRHLYSACGLIETDDLRLLCDPWFTPGAFYGSWFQYPRIADPLGTIGPVDAIYLSHVHDDHCDIPFLRTYLSRYPGTQVLIADMTPPLLARRLAQAKIAYKVGSSFEFGTTQVHIIPSRRQALNIDGALLVKNPRATLLNLNDNLHDVVQCTAIHRHLAGRPVDLMLAPYAHAGSYLHRFDFESHEARASAEARLSARFIGQFDTYRKEFNPGIAVPFAGHYWLGGELKRYNAHRAIPDATELLPGRDDVRVMEEGGQTEIDRRTGRVDGAQTTPMDVAQVNSYLEETSLAPYPYQRADSLPPAISDRELLSLGTHAAHEARRRLPITETYHYCLRAEDSTQAVVINAHRDGGAPKLMPAGELGPQPGWEIVASRTLLTGLLAGDYDWNRAKIGSHFQSHRVPDAVPPNVSRFLDVLRT